MADTFIRCTVSLGETGIERWTDAAGQIHAYRDPNDKVTRLASKGTMPYIQLIPCPWCRTENDRQHDPMQHINKELRNKS